MIDGVILDAGPLVAYLAERDKFHRWAVDTFASLPPLFYTCEAVLGEVGFLVRSNPSAMSVIGGFLREGYLRIPFRLDEESDRVFDLIHRYVGADVFG